MSPLKVRIGASVLLAKERFKLDDSSYAAQLGNATKLAFAAHQTAEPNKTQQSE